MDPNETLKSMRRVARAIIELIDGYDDDRDMTLVESLANDAAELIQAMDEWLLNGGFLPADWRTKK